MTYEFLSLIQSGTYGSVLKVERGGAEFAIKQFHIMGENTKTTVVGAIYLNEIDILKRCDHPNILKLISVAYGLPYHCANGVVNPVKSIPDVIFPIMPLAEFSLFEFSRSEEAIPTVLKRFMAQLVNVTNYLHSHDIGYRDFKSSNVLVFKSKDYPEAWDAVLCDLGMAKQFSTGILNSAHVGTMSYKAPELLLGRRSYGKAVDIWGLGILFFEMFNKSYPFFSGKKDDDAQIHMELIIKIFMILGKPSREVFNKLTGGGNTIISYTKLKEHEEKDLTILFANDSQALDNFEQDSLELPNFGSLEEYVDLLKKMLTMDPDKRITAAEIVDHPFFDMVPKDDQVANDSMWRDLRMFHPKKKTYHTLTKTKDTTRRDMGFKIFEEKVSVNFSSLAYRILFQGVDIFERCMLTIENNPKYEVFNIELLACSCVYIAAKLFLNDSTPHWNSIFPSIECKRSDVILMEQTILMEFLEWKIYRPTIYDLLEIKTIKPKALLTVIHKKDVICSQPIDVVAKIFSDRVK